MKCLPLVITCFLTFGYYLFFYLWLLYVFLPLVITCFLTFGYYMFSYLWLLYVFLLLVIICFLTFGYYMFSYLWLLYVFLPLVIICFLTFGYFLFLEVAEGIVAVSEDRCLQASVAANETVDTTTSDDLPTVMVLPSKNSLSDVIQADNGHEVNANMFNLSSEVLYHRSINQLSIT